MEEGAAVAGAAVAVAVDVDVGAAAAGAAGAVAGVGGDEVAEARCGRCVPAPPVLAFVCFAFVCLLHVFIHLLVTFRPWPHLGS